MRTVFILFGAIASAGAQAQGAPVSVSDQFLELCASEQSLARELPGEDVQVAQAPNQLRQYAENAISARIVKIGDRYAMRSHNPARADPNALVIRCAVTGQGSSFADAVARLSERLSVTPTMSKTQNGFDSAIFRVGPKSFVAYAEPENWVSVFSMDILMRNIDPKYLKKGAKPVPLPPAR